MKIILIGIQGCGKSTQGNILSQKLEIPFLSTGNIFRSLAKEKSAVGEYIKEIINSGALIPDAKTIEIVSEYLSREEYKKGYILDGFPRTLNQAQAFKDNVSKVIYFRLSDKEALWRIAGRKDAREDETLQAIKKRIDLFHKFTEPVIEYFKKKGILGEVDGEKSVVDVTNEILAKIK